MFSQVEVERLLEARDRQWKDTILEQWGSNVLNSVWPVIEAEMTATIELTPDEMPVVLCYQGERYPLVLLDDLQKGEMCILNM